MKGLKEKYIEECPTKYHWSKETIFKQRKQNTTINNPSTQNHIRTYQAIKQ